MPTVTFYNQSDIPDELLKFAVIAARYDDKWVFCRHKERTTWEIPGGHREPGEEILETAKRELYEKTGATEFEIKPVCAYCFTKYGLLCYADIKKTGELPPEMEIGEVRLFEGLPENLTYPAIQPELFKYIQDWLNLQSSPDELWNVYDEKRQLTPRKHRRGDPLSDGEYHLVVDIWIQNKRGEYLITKRASTKGFPHMWECTGGSALAGDDSLSAALREVREETGIVLKPETGQMLFSICLENCFKDVWLFRQEFSLDDIVLQPGETCDARSASPSEVAELREPGSFVPLSYFDRLFGGIDGIE